MSVKSPAFVTQIALYSFNSRLASAAISLQCTHWECKTNRLCVSGALNEYISYVGFICIFCYLPVQALNLLWISALLLARVCSVSCYHLIRTGGEEVVFIFTIQKHCLFPDFISAPVPDIHSFQSKRDLASQMSETNFFSFKKEVKCICI